ncbi:unnamed protein product [Cuscuta campestris]|uniref:Uncharacterized protein n=1 Tax=Cuscuta campestris TaxID=132261 RepID=A0A484MVF8_9ASTE|nr:unnamed protein product [Cuscuta campestris]
MKEISPKYRDYVSGDEFHGLAMFSLSYPYLSFKVLTIKLIFSFPIILSCWKIHSSKEKKKNFNSIGETRRRNHHKFFQNPGSSKPSPCEPFSYILTSLFQSDF